MCWALVNLPSPVRPWLLARRGRTAPRPQPRPHVFPFCSAFPWAWGGREGSRCPSWAGESAPCPQVPGRGPWSLLRWARLWRGRRPRQGHTGMAAAPGPAPSGPPFLHGPPSLAGAPGLPARAWSTCHGGACAPRQTRSQPTAALGDSGAKVTGSKACPPGAHPPEGRGGRKLNAMEPRPRQGVGREGGWKESTEGQGCTFR